MWQRARVLHISGRGRFALICLRKWMKWAPPPPTHTHSRKLFLSSIRRNMRISDDDDVVYGTMLQWSATVRDMWKRERERERHSPRERLQQRSLAVTATRQGAHGHHHSTGKKKKREKKRNKLFCKLDSKSSQPPPQTKRNETKKEWKKKNYIFFLLLLESTCCIFFFSLLFCLLLISSRW